MMNDRELTRLADMGAALRPDWNARNLRAFFQNNLTARSFADSAVALAAIAADETQRTPRLLAEHGPWWTAAEVAFRRTGATSRIGPDPDAERCRYAGHEHEEADRCRACAAERAVGDIPEPRSDAAPAPAGIVAVAERHRAQARAVPGQRRFAQPAELRPADHLAGTTCIRCRTSGANCARCRGFFIDDQDGHNAHHAVFGHVPATLETRTAP
jgi:hypothetical protein